MSRFHWWLRKSWSALATPLGRVWNAKPVPKPSIPGDLEKLSWPERSAVVIFHALLSAESWLSGGGWLREWIRLNV